MSNETEAATQTLGSSSDTIDLRLRQEPEMDTQGIETSADEIKLRLLPEWVKQTADPILRGVEELCALLAGRTELESAANSEASGWKHGNASANPSRTRQDKCPAVIPLKSDAEWAGNGVIRFTSGSFPVSIG